MSESRRDVVRHLDEHGASVTSFTALKEQVEDFSQKAVVLKIQGDAATSVTVTVNGGKAGRVQQTLGDLARSNEMLFTGEFPKESAMLHRVVFADHYQTQFEIDDEDPGDEASWYYARVIQTNDQLAWSSPVWVEAR